MSEFGPLQSAGPMFGRLLLSPDDRVVIVLAIGTGLEYLGYIINGKPGWGTPDVHWWVSSGAKDVTDTFRFDEEAR